MAAPAPETTLPTWERTRQPFWLTKSALLMFFTIFTACAAALVVLDRLMAAQHGFSLTISSSHYSWTYGPTALLVVVLGMWRQLDYYYKLAQPWRELLSGAAPAEKSLLLDYISPFQLCSIFSAFKLGHFFVSGTIFCFFLLKLIILLSTALFFIEPSTHMQPIVITYQDLFDAENAWKSGAYELNNNVDNSRIDMELIGGSDKPAWAYLAKLNNATVRDSAWNPEGDLVTQAFSLSELRSNITTAEAPVDVFLPQVSCETAEVDVAVGSDSFSAAYTFDSATCFEANVESHTGRGSRVICDTDSGPCEQLWDSYMLFRINCSATNCMHPTDPLRRRAEDGEPCDIRYAVTVADHSATSAKYDSNLESIRLLDSASTICKVGYAIASANATHDPSTGRVSFREGSLDAHTILLRNLSSHYFAEMVFTSLSLAGMSLETSNEIFAVEPFAGYIAGDTFFHLMVAQLGHPENTSIPLYNTSVLGQASRSVLEGVATEFARQSLLVSDPGRHEGPANATFSEFKLYARPMALWAMFGGFCLLALIALLMMATVPNMAWIPAMSGSIAGHAAVLTNSPSLQHLLRDTGHYRADQLRERLQGIQFAAIKAANGCARLDICHVSSSVNQCPGKKREDKKPWKPMAVRRPILASMIILPLLSIGILEVLQHISDQRKGLLSLSGGNSTTAWPYIFRLASTGIIFGINSIFNNLDSTTITFAPYTNLRLGSVRAERSLLFHPLGASPFTVLIKSLRHGQFGVAASNLSSLLGSLLPIIVSSLWIVAGPTMIDLPCTASVNNWDQSWLNSSWEQSWEHSWEDGGAAIIMNQIRHGGANTSSRIWQDVVLPKISFSSPNTSTDDVDGQVEYTYNIRTLKPVFNCTVVPGKNIKVNGTVDRLDVETALGLASAEGKSDITVHAPVQPECTGKTGNGSSYLTFYTLFSKEQSPKGIATCIDLDLPAGQVGAECPAAGIIFGLIEGDEIANWNLTALVCTQGLQEVPAAITFLGDPSLEELSPKRPLVPSYDKARSWRNGTGSTKALRFRLNGFPNSYDQPDDWLIDLFFGQLGIGPGGILPDDLVGKENINSLIHAITRQYTEYMRHIIDINFRAKNDTARESIVSAAESTSSSSSSTRPLGVNTEITGTMRLGIRRLAMHSTTKLILQIFMAMTMVLSTASFALVKVRGTLPRQPSSIASTMALLAGSHLCDRGSGVVPSGAEFMSDGQLKRAFDGYLFSLGWWDAGGDAGGEELDRGSEELDRGSEQVVPLDGDTTSDVETGEDKVDVFRIDIGSAGSCRT